MADPELTQENEQQAVKKRKRTGKSEGSVVV
jgi:hypothetical protein